MSAAETATFVVARIGKERFAFDVDGVFEAAEAAGLDRVPQLPAGALGVLRWRGAAHTVWSPQRVLRVEPDAPATVLFFRGATGLVAVAVDDAEDLITLPRTELRAMPGIAGATGLIRGGFQAGDVFATVVDTAVFLSGLTQREQDAPRDA